MRLVLIISVITLLFFLAVGFDISPYLRGPAPYPPDWQWSYLFVSTIERLPLPLLLIAGILFFARILEKKQEKVIKKSEKKILGILVILFFLFQLSVLYFSRAGIGVLFHRIASPDHNGYFTASLSIERISDFLETYNERVLFLPQHAQGHPPGAILFFYALNKIFEVLPISYEFIKHFSPVRPDVKMVWKTLSSSEKVTALFSGFFIPFLSALVVIPLYYLAKMLYGIRVGIRTVLLYVFIPSVVLFIPINDVFLAHFPLLSFLLFFLGLKKEKTMLVVLSGLIFFIGLFFSMSLLPYLCIFLLFFLFHFQLRLGLWFLGGLVVFPLMFFLVFQFNTIEVARTLMSGLPESREYFVWVGYNLYDFFIFLGVPMLLLSIYTLFHLFKDIKNVRLSIVDMLAVSFFIMLFLLDISGSVRGEVARIWLPFVPIAVLIVSNFVTSRLRLSTNLFLFILFLQAVQVLVMQEFWVTLW